MTALNRLHLVIGVLACCLGWLGLHYFRQQSLVSSIQDTIPLGSGQMFDQIAKYYDITNRYLSLGMKIFQAWREYL